VRGILQIGLLTILAGSTAFATDPFFTILSDDPGGWPAILSSIGLQPRPAAVARIFVARTGAPASAEWPGRVERGAILILEGESSLADSFGFRRNPKRDPIRVQSLTDIHRPDLPLIWEKGLELPTFDVPETAQVFARERWSGTPMSAGFRRGAGAVLWVATSPGERGYERFPYLLHALTGLGLEPPFRSNRLWAFYDGAYRSRVDLDYFAARWRKSGIAALHVAAWSHFESDPERDARLQALIAAAHREGILVYAWLELPHVSEKFWTDHPEWREKTALGQDAHLDWRKLMNLRNRDCFRAVSAGVRDLASRFDWDGVNLAELYYESLEGIANPSRFTPSRKGFEQLSDREFLDLRAGWVQQMQEEWLDQLEQMRKAKPWLDLVLTHIDDRFDAAMRDALGADAGRVLPLLDSHSFTFLIEDPATIWNLGPQRYGAIAERYRPLTPRQDRLAIDINIVERYQDVYPTKQQTGAELFQLVHAASASFPRVALYFENSLLPHDLKLLPSAAAAVTRMERVGGGLVVDSRGGVGIPWKGGAKVDGQPWPVLNQETLWLPAGAHTVEAAEPNSAPRLIHFNGDLRSARAEGAFTEFTYQSQSRAIALFDRALASVEIDGRPGAAAAPLLLPRGQHLVRVK
jgi:hypothetical protein